MYFGSVMARLAGFSSVRSTSLMGPASRDPRRASPRLGQPRSQLSVACDLFFFWLEHAGRRARNKATWHQPFAVRAKIIREPGDDIAFPVGQSPQPGSRDLLRALRTVNKFLLPCDGVKLGFRRAGAEGANADAVRLHFFGQPLGK